MFWGSYLRKMFWEATHPITESGQLFGWEHPAALSLLQAARGPSAPLDIQEESTFQHQGMELMSSMVSRPFYREFSVASHYLLQSLGSMNQGWPGTTLFYEPCRGGLHLDSKPWATFHQHIFSRTNVGAKTCFPKVYLQWTPVSFTFAKNLRCQKGILCSARLCPKNPILWKRFSV